MSNRKPWLRYHKPGAPVREFREPEKKPRELFWARLWLIAGLQIGAHRLYLWQYKKAFVWFLILNICVVFLLIFAEVMFPKNVEKAVSIGVPILWIVIIAIEYRRLPKLVMTVNQKQFGSRILNNPLLRGEIGLYSAMRPVMMLAGLSYFGFVISASLLGESGVIPGFLVLITGLSLLVSYRQYSEIQKQDIEND